MPTVVGEVIGGALSLNEEAFRQFVQGEHIVGTSVILLFIVGISWMCGHCAVLFLNRVPTRRFLITTAALGGSFVFGAMLWVGSTWLVASLLPGNRRVPLWLILPMTAFAYAPLVLSILIVIPYVGSGLEVVLNTWALLALILAVRVAFDMGILAALGCALVGWGLTQLLPRISPVFRTAWFGVSAKESKARGEAAAADAIVRMRSS